MTRLTYRHTWIACCAGYVTQAVVNNLAPLLFLTFQREFSVSLGHITALISMNFIIQLLVDLVAVRFVDRIGYRTAAVAAHVFSLLGFIGLGTLPYLLADPYWGIVFAMALGAIGGGLLEVIVSPIVEALPGDQKAASMSLLHSFYCWGSVAVVLLSTLYFSFVGVAHWRYLPLLWALLPLGNALVFLRVPLRSLVEEGESMPLRALFSKRIFWLFFLLMVCAGASEQAMSQWASLFAEMGLGVSKTMGDLLGPCLFAVLMGLSRVFFGSRRAEGFSLERMLRVSALLCMGSYLLAVFAPWPLLSLIGCALCGLSVGIMWPGTFSLASRRYPRGGTAMFAILALAGDVGCASGPGLVGFVSSLSGAGGDGALKMGLLAAIAFPLVLLLSVSLVKKQKAPLP